MPQTLEYENEKNSVSEYIPVIIQNAGFEAF